MERLEQLLHNVELMPIVKHLFELKEWLHKEPVMVLINEKIICNEYLVNEKNLEQYKMKNILMIINTDFEKVDILIRLQNYVEKDLDYKHLLFSSDYLIQDEDIQMEVFLKLMGQ